MWMQSTVERERQDSLGQLEKIRERNRLEKTRKENEEWDKNQAEFLKKRVKDNEERISTLEGMVLQLADQLKIQSDGKWSLDWSKE
tara:strand:- start:525 stop:782 length:258 start_codon:yes stop_codon:yes gene_type:complete